ncbi:MAG: hypothetical protein IMY69_02350, partial [Bacteroidetes bacterium]|nr:hypothetical protein [Bacteroidota bacterium]
IVVVIFNKDSFAKNIIFNIPERYANVELKANFGSKFIPENNKSIHTDFHLVVRTSLEINLDGNSFEILTN